MQTKEPRRKKERQEEGRIAEGGEKKKKTEQIQDSRLIGKRGILSLGLFHVVTLILGIFLLITIWPERRALKSSQVIEARIDSVIYQKDTIANEINHRKVIMNVNESIMAEPAVDEEDSITKNSLRYENQSMRVQIDSLEMKTHMWDDTLAVLNRELYSGDPGYNWKKVLGVQLNEGVTFILIVLLSGLVGSLIASIHSLIQRIRGDDGKTLEKKHVWGYLLRPVFGGSLALVFFFVIHGDLLASSIRDKLIAPYGIAGFSAVVGMFARKAMGKLQEVLNLLFQPKPNDMGEK